MIGAPFYLNEVQSAEEAVDQMVRVVRAMGIDDTNIRIAQEIVKYCRVAASDIYEHSIDPDEVGRELVKILFDI